MTTTVTLPALPGRVLTIPELRRWVAELAGRTELWSPLVRHDTGKRHYASLHRDSDISAGAVAVPRGAVSEAAPRLGGTPATRVVKAGRTFGFGPDHIHRMAGAV